MNKKGFTTIIVIIVLLAFVGVSGLIGYQIAQIGEKGAQEASEASQEPVLGYFGPGISVSAYLEPTGSTTTDDYVTSANLEFPTSDISDGRMNLTFTGSTTNTVLNWYYYFSEDSTTWFNEDNNSTSGYTVTHSPTSTLHTFGTISTTTAIDKTFDLPDMLSKFMKIVFDVDTASGSLDAQIIK